MPTTTRDPRSFDPYAVPATNSRRSRWPVGISPAGHVGRPDETYANLVSGLVADRQTEQPQVLPEAITVELFKVIRDDTTGRYALVERPGVRAIPTRTNTRPGRFAAVETEGVELLNDFLLGREAWEKARDDEIWEALLAAAQDVEAKGRALRQLNDLTAVAICARAGVIVHTYDLAWE